MTAMSFYVKLTKPVKLDANQFNGKLINIKGSNAIEIPQGMVIWQPDDRSVVINTQHHIERFIDNRFIDQPFAATAAWSNVKQHDLFALVSGKLARGQRDLARWLEVLRFQALSVLSQLLTKRPV